jgi:hypothetical protein
VGGIVDCYGKILFSYLMVAGAIDWNICPGVLGMTKGSDGLGLEPTIYRTRGKHRNNYNTDAVSACFIFF